MHMHFCICYFFVVNRSLKLAVVLNHVCTVHLIKINKIRNDTKLNSNTTKVPCCNIKRFRLLLSPVTLALIWIQQSVKLR